MAERHVADVSEILHSELTPQDLLDVVASGLHLFEQRDINGLEIQAAKGAGQIVNVLWHLDSAWNHPNNYAYFLRQLSENYRSQSDLLTSLSRIRDEDLHSIDFKRLYRMVRDPYQVYLYVNNPHLLLSPSEPSKTQIRLAIPGISFFTDEYNQHVRTIDTVRVGTAVGQIDPNRSLKIILPNAQYLHIVSLQRHLQMDGYLMPTGIRYSPISPDK